MDSQKDAVQPSFRPDLDSSVNVGGTNGRKEQSLRRQSVALETTPDDLRSWLFTLTETSSRFATEPINSETFEPMASIFERDRNFNVAAGGGCVHGEGNLIRNKLDHRPLRMLKHDERNFSTCQILLVPDIFV